MAARQTVWHSHTLHCITVLKIQTFRRTSNHLSGVPPAHSPHRAINHSMCHACSRPLKSFKAERGNAGHLEYDSVRVCVRESRLLFIGRYLSMNAFLGECVLECVLILSFWFPFSQMPTERSKSTQRNK